MVVSGFDRSQVKSEAMSGKGQAIAANIAAAGSVSVSSNAYIWNSTEITSCYFQSIRYFSRRERTTSCNGKKDLRTPIFALLFLDFFDVKFFDGRIYAWSKRQFAALLQPGAEKASGAKYEACVYPRHRRAPSKDGIINAH